MNNPFITDHFTTEDAQALVDLALPLMGESGKIPWAKVEAATGIGYSRGWLIVRYAYLAKYSPELLYDYATVVAEARAHWAEKGKETEFDPVRDGIGNMAAQHRDSLALSWGEIAVRLGCPESRVRAAYRSLGAKKDLGLRIGKGGSWAYDEPTLYEDNRRREGAQIPVEIKGRPRPEQLLNFDPEGAAAKAQAAAKAKREAAAKKGQATKAKATKVTAA